MAVSAAPGAELNKLKSERLDAGASHFRGEFGVIHQRLAAGGEIAVAHLANEVERRAQRRKQRRRGSVSRFSLGRRLALFAEIEVVARILRRFHPLPRALADGAIRQARRNHQRLLRSADDDVNSPSVHVEVRGAEAGDGVHDQKRVATVLADEFRNSFYVVTRAGRAFGSPARTRRESPA